MIGGIIVSHGPIAKAIIKAAETILGPCTDVVAISTTGCALKAVIEKIQHVIDIQKWEPGTVIMTSLKGGTCWNAAVTASKQNKQTTVVSGVNLPMLISFLTKRNQLSLDKLTAMIVQDAIRGIDQF